MRHWLMWLIALVFAVRAEAGLEVRVHPLYLDSQGRDDVTRAVVRDHEGYLWIATDNGLKRYDGYRFKVYGAGPSTVLSDKNNAINDILVSDDGLWLVGANLNFFSFPDESFSRYEISFGPSLNTLVEDSSGRLWVGGEGTGLLGFDPQAKKVFRRVFEKQAMGHIRRLHLSQTQGKLWVASSGGLYLYDIEENSYQMMELPLHYGVGVDAIRDIAEDDQGRLWVASDSGAFRVDPASGEFRHYQADNADPLALSTNRLWSVYCDSGGTVWLGTDKKGVHRYQPETDSFDHIPASTGDPDLFPMASISRIEEDSLGNLWFATGQFGVFRISEHLNKFFVLRSSPDTDDSLGFNNVLDLHEDHKGNIWIATDGRGVDRFNPETGQFFHYRHDPNDANSLSSDSAMAIAEADDHAIWVGTWEGGISVIDPETHQIKRLARRPEAPADRTLANNNVFRLEFGPDNELFIAVHMVGLQLLDTTAGRYTLFSGHPGTEFNSMRNNTLNDFWILDSGDAWLGGYQALEYYDASAGTVSEAELAVHEGIMDLYMDDDGILWIATRQRLIRYNPTTGHSKNYTPEHGLADQYVVSINQDSEGFLWLGTRNGLNRFDPQKEKFWRYDVADGIAGNQFNRFSHLKTRSGTLYFGGTNGLTVFDPLNLPQNDTPPATKITRIELGQQWVGADEIKHVMMSSRDGRSQVTLPYEHRDIGFEFTALSFLAPNKNRYSYRLKGLEEDWHEVGAARRYAHYTNLEPGKYVFEVYGSNNDGVWSDVPARVNITVRHAWWQAWWAWAAYLALGASLLYLYGFWRSYKNRHRETRLKTLVEEQTTRLKTANYEISQLNAELEERVLERTKELSNEIEERKQSEQKAHYIAFHDSLTNLFNRTWLLQRIDSLISNRNESSNGFSVIAVGLDRFRRINEVYGHRMGDMILAEVAARLQDMASSPAESAVRSGSDEFVYILDATGNVDEAKRAAEKVMHLFAEPVASGSVTLAVSASVGVVVCDGNCVDANQVMRCANVAMQKAKELGRGRYQVFDEMMLSNITEEAELDEDLKLALGKEQFSVVYQPIVHTRTQKLSCFEILIRWCHPEKGHIPPSKFIPMAESNGQIFDIGLWVLAQACKQLNAWRQLGNGTRIPVISVNLSPIQLEQPDFVQKVKKVIRDHDVAPTNIRFEITETALMRHSEDVDQCLFALRALGVEFAIDDFGTGYSSLSYLDRLPVQILKMDRCFISAIDSDEPSALSAREIVRASISLAHSLDMVVVGEGVETEDQLRLLAEYGCEFAQGYFIAKPLIPTAATEFLSASKGNQESNG